MCTFWWTPTVVGIPSSVEKENLESKVCKVFDKIGVTVTENDTEACNRLKGGKAIVKFCKRKICQNVWRKKRSLKKVKSSDVTFNGETSLFIN